MDNPAAIPSAQARQAQLAVLKRRVWKIALPAISENLLQTSLMMVDTIMIARYGPVALAAAAISGVVVWRAQMTFGCIDKGTMAMAARFAGAKDEERLGLVVGQALLIAAVIGLFMAVAGIVLAPQLLSWMGSAQDVKEAGIPYLQIIAAASVPRIIFIVVAASLRATGDTRTPMWISLWMNIMNVILNFPLIYGIPAVAIIGFGGFAGLGLTGSGISTAISLVFAAVIVCWKVFSGSASFRVNKSHFRPHSATIRTLIRISIPSFLEEAVLSAGFLVVFRFIALLGTTALAAHAISTRIEAVSFMAGLGFAIAAAALVGQALGQKDVGLARDAFRISTKYSVVLMSFVALGLIIWAKPIVSLFAPGDLPLQEMAALLLVIAALEQPILAVGMTVGGGLRGAGDTMTPMISSLLCGVGVRVGTAYFFAFPMGYGVYGIYLGSMADWVTRSLLLYWFFKIERWTRIKI